VAAAEMAVAGKVLFLLKEVAVGVAEIRTFYLI
jgi:hypothetical protein